MSLIPFDQSHVVDWQRAVDQTDPSPSAFGGPEFASTMIRSKGGTYLFRSGELLVPFARGEARHMRVYTSDLFVGGPINSLLGVTEITDSVFEALRQLPRRSTIKIDLPEDRYRRHKERFDRLFFFPEESYCYHKIELRGSYDEWFSRPEIRRNTIRHGAQSGVDVSVGGVELLPSFHRLYLSSFQRWESRQTAVMPHEYERFQKLFDLPGSRVKIAAARLGEKVIATVIFCHYQRTAAYLFGGIDYDYQNVRPNNLLHAEIIRYLIDQGVQEYNLGISLSLRPLERFKETLGAERHISVTLCRHRFPRLKAMAYKMTGRAK